MSAAKLVPWWLAIGIFQPRLCAKACCTSGESGLETTKAARVDLRQGCGQHIELLLPAFGIAIEPQRRVEQRAGAETAAADAAGALLLDQPGAHQHLDMA